METIRTLLCHFTAFKAATNFSNSHGHNGKYNQVCDVVRQIAEKKVIGLSNKQTEAVWFV